LAGRPLQLCRPAAARSWAGRQSMFIIFKYSYHSGPPAQSGQTAKGSRLKPPGRGERKAAEAEKSFCDLPVPSPAPLGMSGAGM
jgi:hypothetical protein